MPPLTPAVPLAWAIDGCAWNFTNAAHETADFRRECAATTEGAGAIRCCGVPTGLATGYQESFSCIAACTDDEEYNLSGPGLGLPVRTNVVDSGRATYYEAVRECAAWGGRLCTAEELLDSACCGTGWYDALPRTLDTAAAPALLSLSST